MMNGNTLQRIIILVSIASSPKSYVQNVPASEQAFVIPYRVHAEGSRDAVLGCSFHVVNQEPCPLSIYLSITQYLLTAERRRDRYQK